MKKTISEIVKTLLEYSQELRDSDRKLVWRTWEAFGFVKDGVITKEDFMNAPNYTTIDRKRRNFQQSDNLTGTNMIQASPEVRKIRKTKASQHGFEQISATKKFKFDRKTNMAYIIEE